MISFGDRVREARQRIRAPGGARLTQGELARAVGVERNTVSRWENSGVRPKDPFVVRRLAAALRVPMEWLFAEEPEGTASTVPPLADRPASGAGVAAGTTAAAAWGAQEAVARRVPPRAYEAIDRYLERLEQSGAASSQIEEVGRLLVESATTRLRTSRPADRPLETVLADIDAAWEYIAGVLRAEGTLP